MQGRLREKPLFVKVESSCAKCGAPLTFEMDSDLGYHILAGSPEPLLFQPFVDFMTLPDPSIIDAF